MKFLRSFTILAVVICAIAAVSCKKEEETTSKSYLSGTIKFDFPSYVRYGDVIHVSPTGVYKGDNEADSLVAYKWTNPFTDKEETLREESDPADKSKAFDFKISKDTLTTLTLIISASAEGYYDKTASASFTIVNPTLGTGSLKGYDFLAAVPSFTDARDGLKYYYNNVGGKDWMIQNLAWAGAGIAYGDAEQLSDVLGRFYTWTEAASACPAGWHLPSNAEYKALAEAVAGKEEDAAGALMVNATFNGDKLWEFWPDVKISNKSRFSAIPLGYAVIEDEKSIFRSYKEYAMFWTADASGADMGVARYIYVDKPAFFSGEFGKESLRANVRCVR